MTDPSTAEQRVEAALERYRRATVSAHAAAQAPGTGIVSSTGTDEAMAMKAGLVEQRAAVLRAQQEADEARVALREAIDEHKRAIEAQVRKLEAELEPVMKKAKRLGDGIDALNIYLGRDEEIEQLRDGARAPADEIISVRQLVLSMAEESLIGADEEGMDYSNIGDFCAWLLRSPDHLDQVLPERKGVVALVPRWDSRDYGNPWESSAKNQANRHTHWLIRNGECLWLTSTEFVVGKTTVPTEREFTSLFERRTFNGVIERLEPGTKAWADAEDAADSRTRHYMKVALLLQGLLDRTAVFHPHEGASFLTQADYDAGRVRVIADAENQLGTGRPSFREWQKDLMSRADVGMRVVGAFATRLNLWGSRDEIAEVYPKGALPQNLVAYVLKKTSRAYFDFQFSFDRQDQVWSPERGYYTSERKATAYISRTDPWVLPIDLVTVDELNYYLHSRSERHQYLDMVPTIRAAIAVKEAEAEAEAPFRAALIGRLAAAAYEDEDALADELISWYKTANRWHRALDPDDAKAARLILAEARRRSASGDSTLVAQLRERYSRAIVVARRTSDLVVIEPQERTYQVGSELVFATVHIHGLRGAHRETRLWQRLRRSQIARWTGMWESEAWSSWVLDPAAGDYFTDEDFDYIVRRVRERHPETFLIRVRTGEIDKYQIRGEFFTTTDAGVKCGSIILDTSGGDLRASTRSPRLEKWSIHGAPWAKSYSNTPKDSDTIWCDEQQLDREEARWQAWKDRQQREDALGRKTRSLVMEIEHAWRAEQMERIRLRFIEDFGDPSLWEGHSKSVEMPRYPYVNHKPRFASEQASHLDAIVGTLVQRGVTELAGKSVREAAELISFDVESIPADVRDLRWSAPKSE